MVRVVIIGIVVAVAFTLYALVDAAMTDASRARGVSKPVWVVIVVLLPVIGGVLWFLIGKGAKTAAAPRRAPDDDPRFTGTRLSNDDLDAHMRDLEERLRELDNETFPGEDRGDPAPERRPEATPEQPAEPHGPETQDPPRGGGDDAEPSGDGDQSANGSDARPDGDAAQK
ncbi:PLDc N-terminal domain-containing protein [Leucobacter sp.]